ncbi:MarR family transcriptional regulator [Propionibacterium sp.]|uniref:MarR family transcriptional regulator n=1 Tax=Propionibacterium sp. TaxID=1977903 RepID=UPI0039E88C16
MDTGTALSPAADALHQIREARALMADVASMSRAVGISLEGFLALAALAEVTPQGMSMTDLAKATGATSPTLTRHIDILATKSLVYREIDPRDRRSTFIYISKLGLARLVALADALGGVR